MDEMIRIADRVSVNPIPTEEVLSFAQAANPENLEDMAIWSKAGSDIPNTTTPFEAFSEQLDLTFPSLAKSDQEALLRNSFRMVFGDFPERGASSSKLVYNPWTQRSEISHEDQFVLFRGGVVNESGITYTNNIATYLEKTLEMTNGDIEAAKTFLLTTEPIKYQKTKVSLAKCLSLLYGSRELNDSNRKEASRFIKLAEEIRAKYQGSDPKARALAFWADTRFGTFNFTHKNADVQVRDVLEENDPALKTEVLDYIKEQILSDEPGYDRKHALIERIIRKERALYLAVKEKHPNSSYVQNYEMIQRMLALRRMESRLEGNKITPKDLNILLTFYPTLITHISVEELNHAINSSEDPDVSQALRNILQRKKALESLPQPDKSSV